MESRKEQVVTVFADLSFIIITVLISGYLFVEQKDKTPERGHVDETLLMEKEIELPTLNVAESGNYQTEKDILNIEIPRQGGVFIIGGNDVDKAQLQTFLDTIVRKNVNLLVDKDAPSEDTLYLLSILSKFNSNVNVLHVREELL